MTRDGFRDGLSEAELQALKTPASSRPLDRPDQPVDPKLDSNDKLVLETADEATHQALGELHRNFAAAMSGVFSDITKRDVEVRLRDDGKGTYAQFVFGQPIPTCCAIVTARSIDVEFFISIQPSILYPLIDQMLGTVEAEPIPQRPLSEIERGLVEVMLQGVFAKYEDAWRQVLSFDLVLDRFEHNLQQNLAMGGSEATYRARYSVRCGSHTGIVEFCLPWQPTQQVRQRLATRPSS